MNKGLIKNFDELAITPNRKMVLEIAEAGLKAINTEIVILNSIKLENNILKIQDSSFNLDNFKKIKIIGFGKASAEAAFALEKILGNKIAQGIVIGPAKFDCIYVEIIIGTHPKPSAVNFQASKKIVEIIENSDKDDLIIAIVSGGGSAYLCYPESEYIQGEKLYDEFLKTGQSRVELNTIWKHISLLKGGGLAKLAYPATVIGLIFSDIPGNYFENIASGSTYMDQSTVANAEKIILENNLGEFDLIETPKESKYFEKVHNFVLVSNEVAVAAMAKKAQEFGLQANIVSTELCGEIDKTAEEIFSAQSDNSVALAAGEPRIEVKDKKGKGGRNLHLGLQAMKNIDENSVFISLASDGVDNSDVAGVVIDKNTKDKAQKLGLDIDDYLEHFDSYSFFEQTKDMINTGPTGSNVSDLMILLTKK